MAEQERLVDEFEKSQADFNDAISGLSEDRASEVWCGTWGVKQIVAHIAGWQSTMSEALEKIARGERPTVEGVDLNDTDGSNAKFAQSSGASSYQDALSGLSNSVNRMTAAIRAIPNERLEEGRAAHRIITTMIRHPGEHAGEIREWRKGRPA
jgi:hypothetical protein